MTDAVQDSDAGDTSEIVVRNQQGEIELGDPPTPILEDDDDAEHAALDRHENESAYPAFHALQRLTRVEERQRLAEAVKRHSINHSTMSSQGEGKTTVTAIMNAKSTELLEAVRTSLRAKVTALADDNWMFEPDEPTR